MSLIERLKAAGYDDRQIAGIVTWRDAEGLTNDDVIGLLGLEGQP